MNKQEIEELINARILEHEVKVALVSGILGTSVLIGIIHSIWILKNNIS